MPTQAQAARELGIARSTVHEALGKPEVTEKKPNTRKPPQPTIKLAAPETTAANIHRKMGAEYAAKAFEMRDNDRHMGRLYQQTATLFSGVSSAVSVAFSFAFSCFLVLFRNG